jgi:hypothetical protein
MNIDHGVRNSIHRTGLVAQVFASFALPYNLEAKYRLYFDLL